MKPSANEPAQIRGGRFAQSPSVPRIEWIWLFDACGRECLPDRLEELHAVLFDERFEEGHAQHFALPLINARSEEFVDVVAEHVPFEERAAAVRFHEQINGRFFLSFAAKDLGDDALHLAAIALIQKAGAPLDERIAANDEGG